MARVSVAGIRTFVEGSQGNTVHVGVDVHKRSYSVALLRSDGVWKEWTAPSSPKALESTLLPIRSRIGAVVYEAGPCGFGLARRLIRAGIPVIVAAPSRIPRPVAATSKTDRLDGRKLAEYAASGMLRPIAVPTEAEEGFRALVRRRHRLTDSIRHAKQRIRGRLLQFGIPEPAGIEHWGKTAIAEVGQLPLPPGADMTRDSLLRELFFLIQEREAIEEKLRRTCRAPEHEERVKALTTVSGVGEIVATTFAAEVFRPGRFQRPEEVTSYLGLAPVVRQSGGGKARARIRPVGQRRLRSLLIEAAWMWKQRDTAAETFYRRILGRTGLPQKAIVAVARKLAVTLWRLSASPAAA
jgi:transposase